MPKFIDGPSIIKAAGNKKKIIKEFFGKVSTENSDLSIAIMNSPEGWTEPGQKPDFDEYTVVLKGVLHVKTIDNEYDILEGQGIVINRNEWVQYSSPNIEGAQYVSVCVPAFTPDTVHRDDEGNN